MKLRFTQQICTLFLGGKKKVGRMRKKKNPNFWNALEIFRHKHYHCTIFGLSFPSFKMSPPKPACRKFHFWPSEANKCIQL